MVSRSGSHVGTINADDTLMGDQETYYYLDTHAVPSYTP
jgi:hypothetical protein